MKVLLDTHAFLWWISDDPQLSARARSTISDAENEIFLSAASGWEIAIKTRLGRLTLPEPPGTFINAQMNENAVQALPVHMHHTLHVYELPLHHRDPFDRVLVAQCQLENLPILTVDPQIGRYEVDVIW